MLTVVCPVLNEERFIRAWCENVARYADEVVVIDTGSTDGTREILRSYGIGVYREPAGTPEPEVRNTLLALAKGDWILRLDADELLIAEDMLALKAELPKIREQFIFLPHYIFWRSTEFIRSRDYREGLTARHFHPCYEPILWKNDRRIRYVPHGGINWNSRMVLDPWGRIGPRLFHTRREKPVRFHYHYLAGKSGHRSEYHDREGSGVRCETYLGPHPEELKYYGT